jgi:hypothetical protein
VNPTAKTHMLIVLTLSLLLWGLAWAAYEAKEFVLVNNDDGAPYYVEEVGEWRDSAGRADCPGIANIDSRYTIQGVNPGARATFTPDIPRDGFYCIEMAVPPTASASDRALYVIRPGGGAISDSVWVDQNTTDYNPCEWKYLGIYYFIPGRGNSVSVVNDGTGAGYVIRTDLMKFTYCSPVQVVSETPVAELPKTHTLLQNYPNPFNASTEICYQLPVNDHVSLKIFNTLGQEVRTLVDANQSAGGYGASWDGRDAGGKDVASGLYFCRLKAGDRSKTIKMVLVR